MTLASPPQSVPGTVITAAKINDPVNNIAAVVNGNIDDSNVSSISGSKIAPGSITTSTLAASAVTKAKIDYTSVDVYSATETDTGKKWVDGRTIYRKVLRGQVTVAASTNNIAHGITGFTTSMEIISINGGLKLSQTSVAGGQVQTTAYRESSGNWYHINTVDSTNIGLVSSFAWGNTYYNIILEYVK